MTQVGPLPEKTPPGGREPLVLLALAAWLIVGFAFLVWGETPHGRLAVRVVAQESGASLANASVFFSQGERQWTCTADAAGRCDLPAMPAGPYRVWADSRAHRLTNSAFSLAEGERRELLLALPPVAPFLEIIHPQPVFLPGETAKIGLRGFTPAQRIAVEIVRVRPGAGVPTSDLFGFLESVRLGWWQGPRELEDRFAGLSGALVPVRRYDLPVVGRDAEGVFLRYLDFEPQAPGTYLVRLRLGALQQTALVVRTTTGLVLKGTGDRQLVAWTTGLADGVGVGGLRVSLWGDRRFAGRTRSVRLAAGTSGGDGLVRLRLGGDLAGVERVWAVAEEKGEPVAWASQYLASPEEVAAPLVGHLYSERPVYRPGNRVFLKGVVRNQAEAGYRLLPAGTAVTLSVRDPDGTVVHRAAPKLSDFDSFTAELTLPEEAKTGSYAVSAEVAGQRIEGDFEVAAYRKPTFKIALTPRRHIFTARDEVQLDLDARYYFGLPVGGARVRYTVYRLPLYEWSGEDGEVEEGEDGGYGEFVLEGTAETDTEGRATIRLRPADIPLPRANGWIEEAHNHRYTVSVTLAAAGDEFAEAEARFPVVQGALKLTVEASPTFTAPNTPVTVRLTVTDRETGRPRAALVRWRAGTFDWAGEGGRVRWQGETLSVRTAADGRASFRFVPPKAGDWVVQAQTDDDQGNGIIAQTSVWISGAAEGIPRSPAAPPLQVLTDQRSYRVGEVARVAVRSRIPDAAVLVAVEGDRLHSVRVVRLKNGVARLDVPVESGFVAGAYVTASLVRDKRFAQQSAPLRLAVASQGLTVTVASDRPHYEPGQTAELTVTARTPDGRPVQAELSLAVVDESLYAVREDTPGALFDALYARRSNRVNTEYSFPWIALQGDKGSGETVRRNFPDTAYWQPQIVTDSGGEARVRLRLPDSLTQWRVTAIAQTAATRVGHGVGRFVSAKEFAVRLSVPTVLTEGDETTVSAVVSNSGTTERTATVRFLAGGEVGAREVRVQPGGSEAVQWTWRAQKLGKIPLQVRAASTDGRQDAEERTVQILPHARERVESQSLVLGPGARETQIAVPEALLADESRLEVRLAPSVFAPLVGTLDYLVEYPYGCTEQTMSRFLPALAVSQLIAEKGLDLPALRTRTPEAVRRGLARLTRFQHGDGGWGWWENDSNDLFMTAYVVHGLALTRRSGVEVNEEVFRLGRESLAAQLEARRTTGFDGKNQPRYGRDTYAFGLYALALAGGEQPERPAAMLALSERVTPYGQAMLLLAFERWGLAQEARLVRERLLASRRLDDTGTYWPVRRPDEAAESTSSWFGHGWLSDSETTAWALIALLESPERIDGELADSAVRWLLAHRRAQGWESTKDSAAAIEALLAYARRFERIPSGTLDVRVLLDDRSVSGVTFTPAALWSGETVLSVPLAGITPGAHRLRFEVAGDTPVYANVVFRRLTRLAEGESRTSDGPLRMERTYALVRGGRATDGTARFEETALKDGEAVPAGSLVRVHVRVAGWPKDHDVSHLIVEDPLPGGFRLVEEEGVGSGDTEGGSYYTFEGRDDRAIGYYRYFWGKTLEFDYLLRAEVPGTYHVLPGRLWSMYAPWLLEGTEMHLGVRP